MASVDAFEAPDGTFCRFHSNDHLPPHFHLLSRDGSMDARIYFLEPENFMVEVKIGSVRGPLRRQITALAARHRAALLREWSEKVQHDED